MPNYSYVSNVVFNPFTYDELVKPLQQQTEAQQALEEQYNEYATRADALRNMIDKDRESKAYAMYNNFNNQLSSNVDDLLSNGLNGSSRRALMNTRRQYATEINPIAVAATRRRALADEQRKAMATDKSLRYERMANQMSLDDLIANPELDYGNSVSLDAVTNKARTTYADLKNIARNPDGLKRMPKDLASYVYQYANEKGMSLDRVQNALLTGDDDLLMDIAYRVADTTGVGRNDADGNEVVSGWGDANLRRDVLNAAKLGMTASLGETTYTPVTDSYNSQLALMYAKDKLDHPERYGQGNGVLDDTSMLSDEALRTQLMVKNDWEELSKIEGVTIDSSGKVSLSNELKNTLKQELLEQELLARGKDVRKKGYIVQSTNSAGGVNRIYGEINTKSGLVDYLKSKGLSVPKLNDIGNVDFDNLTNTLSDFIDVNKLRDTNTKYFNKMSVSGKASTNLMKLVTATPGFTTNGQVNVPIIERNIKDGFVRNGRTIDPGAIKNGAITEIVGAIDKDGNPIIVGKLQGNVDSSDSASSISVEVDITDAIKRNSTYWPMIAAAILDDQRIRNYDLNSPYAPGMRGMSLIYGDDGTLQPSASFWSDKTYRQFNNIRNNTKNYLSSALLNTLNATDIEGEDTYGNVGLANSNASGGFIWKW